MARFARYASPLPRENTDVRQRRFRAHSSSCSHLEVWRFTGKQFVHRVQRVMSQSTITGLGASTRSVCLSHSLEFWQQQQKFTVARPHLNFICRVFQGRATGAKPNWAFNVDANSGHAFGILLAAVGALRPCGAPAPVN
jgi:hypothetical protein